MMVAGVDFQLEIAIVDGISKMEKSPKENGDKPDVDMHSVLVEVLTHLEGELGIDRAQGGGLAQVS